MESNMGCGKWPFQLTMVTVGELEISGSVPIFEIPTMQITQVNHIVCQVWAWPEMTCDLAWLELLNPFQNYNCGHLSCHKFLVKRCQILMLHTLWMIASNNLLFVIMMGLPSLIAEWSRVLPMSTCCLKQPLVCYYDGPAFPDSWVV